jgi:hypothetical protein
VLNFGYRIDCDGASLFFTGDFEIPVNIYQPEDDDYESFERFLAEKNQEILEAMQDVDALIIDSSYTDEEYAIRLGWGHGTYRTGIKLAAESNAKRLFLTHHEPTRTDADLDLIYQELLDQHPQFADKLFIAQEGMEVRL